MLFNSVQFLIFFPAVLLLFYLLPVRYRWVLLLVASFYFYMAWKAEYVLLIIASILINYWCANEIHSSESSSRRKFIFRLSLFFNLGMLFVFKYFNFFNDNLNELFSLTGIGWNSPAADLILPMGISFYTFQVMSYVIDVYKYNLKPEKHLGIFSLFVTFFPQLVAGPIERAGNLISQLRDLRNKIDNEAVISGFQLIVIGFFKKLVIADRVSVYVDRIFLYPEGYSGLHIAIAVFFFSVQIYCDFSGYSDIATGSARLLGVRLMDNFKSPYFSTSISEFWSRWHISLSTWFRDYVYIPLGGNRVVKWKWYYNLIITFLVSGFWHGANWTFLAWGFIHGSYLVLGLLFSGFNNKIGNALFGKMPLAGKLINMTITFILVYFAWIFFRAENIGEAFFMIDKIMHLNEDLHLFEIAIADFGVFSMMVSWFAILLLVLYEFLLAKEIINKSYYSRLITTTILTVVTLTLGEMGSKSFIYFQF